MGVCPKPWKRAISRPVEGLQGCQRVATRCSVRTGEGVLDPKPHAYANPGTRMNHPCLNAFQGARGCRGACLLPIAADKGAALGQEKHLALLPDGLLPTCSMGER